MDIFKIAVAICLVLGTIFFYILKYVYQKIKHRNYLVKQFGSEPHHWLYGHLHIFPGLSEEGMLWGLTWLKKYPKITVFCVGPLKTTVGLNHPDVVKELTRTAEPKQMTDGGSYRFMFPWIGDGLLISTGAKWFRNRKLLTPGFHFEILKPYVYVYNTCVSVMLDKIENHLHTSAESIDIFPVVSLCTLDIVLRCAFSTNKNIQRNDNSEYVKTVLSLSKQIIHRIMRPQLYMDAIYYSTTNGRKFRQSCSSSHDVAWDIIRNRQKELQLQAESSESKRSGQYVDFLDILLLAKDSDGKGLSDQEILDEVETFMFEGHDTTASGISWILYNLAKHPQYQQKAYEEVECLLSGRDTNELTWKDMNELPYLTRCIKESLRSHPPVPFIGRQLSQDMVIGGKTIPAGTHVDINIWNVHHNELVWPDYMTYNPDRFLPENIDKMDSHAFIPFSAGPRNCIGQHFAMNEMTCVVARILHKFELVLDEKHVVKFLPDIVLRAVNGIYIYFKHRT